MRLFATEKAARRLAKEQWPILSSWVNQPGRLDDRRRQLGRLCDAIDDVLKAFDDADAVDGDIYRHLFDALSCLMLALGSKPISRPLCVKAFRHLQSAATANLGVVAG